MKKQTPLQFPAAWVRPRVEPHAQAAVQLVGLPSLVNHARYLIRAYVLLISRGRRCSGKQGRVQLTFLKLGARLNQGWALLARAMVSGLHERKQKDYAAHMAGTQRRSSLPETAARLSFEASKPKMQAARSPLGTLWKRTSTSPSSDVSSLGNDVKRN